MKVELRRLRLNGGGYTSNGNYFGVGAPLFQYWIELPDTFSCFHRYGCSEPEKFEHRPAGYCCSECEAIAYLVRNDVCEEIRAESREHAKEIIRRKYPEAKFYR